MDLFEAIRTRRTTNGPFRVDAVSREHQHLLVELAGHAPSHFNSQPWRFLLVEEEATRRAIARISGECMTRLMQEGTFWRRYRPYFRFSEKEIAETGDGILIDQLPAPVRPFTKALFSVQGTRLMARFGMPQVLGGDNEKLVAGSPLILGVLLTRQEYRPGELSAFYSVFGMGAAVQNIWLATRILGLGIQFISTPMEIPEAWREICALLGVPEELELMALYRIGYLPEDAPRPSIDWTSRHRKRLSQYVFRENCRTPEPA